jgi:CHAT domain-containing protein
MPEQFQLTTLLNEWQQDSHASFFHCVLSMALEDQLVNGTAERSAGWILNGKGLAQEALAAREVEARNRGGEAAQKLLQLRAELAARAYQKQAVDEDQLLEVETVATAFGKTISQRADSWVDARSVRALLPSQSVLLEFARFRRWDFRSGKADKWLPARYAVWVIPPLGRGNIEIVDLGEAGPIDRAAQAVVDILRDGEKRILQGEDVNVLADESEEKKIRQALETLGRLTLWKLPPAALESERLILSPDGNLWQVPWVAVPLRPNGPYAVEEKTISCIISGRDLVRPVTSAVPAPARLFANPDYSAGKNQGKTLRIPPQRRLAKTAVEANKIRPFVESLTGRQAEVFMDANAVEGRVKASRNPAVMVLSTHGFCLDDKDLEHPLLRCGLLFSGSNFGADGQGQDGVLTGSEVLGIDLRGTELVVLSACQTAQGQVNAGEGVASLRQAFHLAGARTVVGTLWSVPDEDTQAIVVSFFEGLAQQRLEKAAALCEAQRKYVKDQKTKFGSAHPFYWAALTLTGDPGKYQ